jgi:hypothetical protein
VDTPFLIPRDLSEAFSKVGAFEDFGTVGISEGFGVAIGGVSEGCAVVGGVVFGKVPSRISQRIGGGELVT